MTQPPTLPPVPEVNPGEQKSWDDLIACDPHDVCRRAICEYDESTNTYSIRVMLMDYLVCPDERKLYFAKDKSEAKMNVRVFILSYMTNAKELPPSNEMITPLTLKSGPTFFRGPHIVWVFPVQKKYGDDPGAFNKRCEELGAEPYPHGDAGMKFDLFPRVPAAYVLRTGDDEFPAEVTVLFDKNIEEHIPMDMIWGAIFFMTKIISG